MTRTLLPLFSFFVLLFISSALAAQCSSNEGWLRINEVSNPGAVKGSDRFGTTSGEFIELIVMGADSSKPVDVSGFIIDDNNNMTRGYGGTSGHIVLGDCFNEVMPGTIIVIFDDGLPQPGINRLEDGTPNATGVYQVPFSSPCLIKKASCPAGKNSKYSCAATGGTKFAWADFLDLDDVVDLVQIRNSKQELEHAVMWWPKDYERYRVFQDQYHPNAVRVSDGIFTNKAMYFTDGDPMVAANFTVVEAYLITPSAANEAENAAYIQAQQPIVCAGEPITLGCPGDKGHCFVWHSSRLKGDFVGQGNGTATVYPNGPTIYRRTTLDGEGNIVNESTYSIRTHPGFTVTITEEQLNEADCVAATRLRFTATVSDEYEWYAYAWSSGEKTSVVELQGDQTYQLTVTAPNGCQSVVDVIPQGDPDQTGMVHIETSSPIFCGGQPIQLTTTFTNYSNNGTRSYQWSNGATTSHTQVYLPGEYRVTVTTSAGCTFTDTIEIGEGYEMTIESDNDLACPSSPAILSAVIFLGNPDGLTYEWSTGEWTPTISVAAGGNYGVTVTDATGCSLASSIDIEGGVALELAAATDRLTESGTVDITPELTGGIAPFQYQWSSGATSDQLSVNVAGTYALTVTDAAGCTATDVVDILPFEPALCEGIDVALLFHEPDCDHYGSARIETVVPSGFEVSSYAWSSGANTPDLLIDAGQVEYTVTLTATNGCQTEASITPPTFASLNNAAASAPLCALVEHLEIISLADDQATLIFEALDQATLATLLNGANGTSLEVVAEYKGTAGPVIEVVPFVSPTDLPDPATWAGRLFDLPEATEVTVSMQLSNAAFCPVVCTDTKLLYNPGAADSTEVVLEEDPEILLTDYDCGETFTPDETTTNTEPLITLAAGEVITVNGFPLLVKTVSPNASSTGNYQGTGLIPLPFNDRNLLVNFSGVVNKYRNFIEGDIEGVGDQLSNYDFSMDTLFIGGEICIPQEDEDEYDENEINPVTGLDRFGFDSTGINIHTGTTLDTLGFDAEGNHVETGTPYNEQGCSRLGRDENDNPCDPQRYIDPAAQAFMDSLNNSLPGLIDAALAAALQEAQALLAAQSQACQNLRGAMEALRDSLGFEGVYIYGDSSQYFDPGLSQEFEHRPEPFALNGVARDPQVVRLEAQHIQLDSCDIRELALIAEEALILGADAGAVLSFIIDKLSNLNGEQVGELSDPAAFATWLSDQLTAYLNSQNSADGTLGQLEGASPPMLYHSPNQVFNDYPTLAAGTSNLAFADRAEMIRYELNAQLEQGFRTIQGVHRAHFLAELATLKEAVTDSTEASNMLPLSVSNYIGGLKYTILLDEVRFDPVNGATLSAFLILEDPDSGQKLVFEGYNIGFGVGGTDGSTLALASTVAIRISNAAKLILEAGETFVDWDCQGFAGMGVGGKVELCRDFITPLNEITLEPLPDPERFSVDVNVYVAEWLDAVVTVDAGAFAITNHQSIKWQLDTAIIDLSNKVTPHFEPTEGYASQHYDPQLGFSPHWRGFYLANLSATLPNDFSTSSDAVTVGVEDVLIDGTGFSGEAYVEGINLLSMEDGSAGGWPFSIDRFNVKVLHNGFAGAGFGGGMILPIFTDTLSYEAEIYKHGRYKFTVSPDTAVTMDMLLAEVDLLPATKIEIGYDYDGFLAVADLTGNMRFNVPDTSIVKLTLPELYFKEFRVSNRDPYFDAGMWEIRNLGVNMDFGGFSMDLSRIRPYKGATSRETGLGFDLSIGLVSELEITAGGRFGILGELEEINQRQRWKFKKIDLQGLFIDANIKDVMHIEGSLQWFNDDPDYGKGFFAMLDAEFTKDPLNFSAQVAAQFGKREETKYFFVDAMVGLGSGIPVGPLNINGFGGGVSYHMDNTFEIDQMDFGGDGLHSGMPAIGSSFSGARYFVAPQYGLGLKAAVMVATELKSTFNGWAGLEFLFNDRDHGGGLAKISFKGQGQFMADVLPDPPEFMQEISDNISEALPIEEVPSIASSEEENTPDPPISAWVDLTYNFNDNVFDGKLEAYLTGGGILQGAGPRGRLVQAALHVDSDDWYLNIGTPTEPAGILVNLPFFNAGATAYFNMGTDIPDFPGLPNNVLAMANLINTNESLRKSGGGIMFGARLFAEARLKAGPVQGFLEADLGFDLMLRNYGNAICAGSGQRIGLNGWYAAGQAWVYLNGGVKLFGVPIFEAGVAGVMQARLPNPLWAKATLAARVKLLFVEKKINLNVEIGEQCQLVDANGEEVNENPLINYISPFDGAPEVATDARPEVYFNMPINRIFKGPNGENFSAKVTEHTLTTLSGVYHLSHRIEWGEGSTNMILIPDNLLYGDDSVRVTITVEVKKDNVVERTETQTVTFATATAYDFIPTTNVAHTYPVDGMYDFYPEEYHRQEGFVQLKAGQGSLLNDVPAGAENKVLLTAANGTEKLLDFSYNTVARKISFGLPANLLEHGALYELALVQHDGKDVVKELLEPIHFRVSEQDLFLDKLALMEAGEMTIQPTRGGAGFVGIRLPQAAVVGDVARFGTGLDDPLIRFQAALGNPYTNDLEDLMYTGFPITTNRGDCKVFTTEGAGNFSSLTQAAGIQGGGNSQPLLIGNDEFVNGFVAEDRYQVLEYNVPQEAYLDYVQLRNRVASCVDKITADFEGEPQHETERLELRIRSSLTPRAYRFYQDEFLTTPSGRYYVLVSYYLPNGNQTTTGTYVELNYVRPSGGGFLGGSN